MYFIYGIKNYRREAKLSSLKIEKKVEEIGFNLPQRF
jgi:hypothetical protein